MELEKKRVGCLYRVSTKKQVNIEDDIPMQRNACMEFILPKTWSGCRRNTPLCWYQFVLVRVSIPAQTS